MEIVFYLFLLLICEIFVYCLIIGLDYYFKNKKSKLTKKWIFMLKSNHDKTDKISCVAFWFQLFNYFYVLLYLSIAIIDTFVYRSAILFNINFCTIIAYSGVAIISLIVISILSPKKQ